jgi:hypothetical protein
MASAEQVDWAAADAASPEEVTIGEAIQALRGRH